MANDFRSARYWAAELIACALFNGACAVDATMGNGHDTCKLCECVGELGRVFAFDVQQEALASTEQRLQAQGLAQRAELILDGHEHMSRYLAPQQADAIVFNLGWLPGAAHEWTTHTDTTLAAVNQALEILKEDGVMTICVYPGHDEGARERDALLQWARQLDARTYDVMLRSYINQPNDPPFLLAVKRNRKRKQ